MKKSILKQIRLCSMLFIIVVSNNAYSQGFATSNYIDNTLSPIYVNGTSSNGIYIGKGTNSIVSNIGIGIGTLTSATGVGISNLAIGQNALKNSTTDAYNVALGNNTLLNLNNGTGGTNIAIGINALKLKLNPANGVSSGIANIAIGYNTMSEAFALTAGGNNSNNIAIGNFNLINNNGDNNIAIGLNSLGTNTTGNRNTAIGYQTLQNNQTGIGNTALGQGAMNLAVPGQYNVGISYESLNGVTGNFNIGIGYQGLKSITSGSKNIGIGFGADVPNNNQDGQLSIQNIIYGVNNTGYGTIVSSGSIGIGTNSGFGYVAYGGAGYGTNVISTQGSTPPPANYKLAVNGWASTVGLTIFSDERLKKEIKKIETPLVKISSINGYTYKWDKEKNKNLTLDDNMQAGFLAQEIAKVLPEAVMINSDGIYGVNYNAVMPLLTEGIKEQKSQIEKLILEIEEFKTQITELQNKLNKLTPGAVKIKTNSIEVNPNPITGTSIVAYKLDDITSTSFLIISDLQGKLIKQVNLTKNQQRGQVQINKKELPNGMYVFSIVSGNTEIQSKKVLVSE